MRLADVLDEARRRTFVGRDDELSRFGEALSGRSPRRVFLVHGVGGIGKSTLLGEFRARAEAAGRPAVLLDGRELDPSPEAVRAALGPAAPLSPPRPRGGPGLLLVPGPLAKLAPGGPPGRPPSPRHGSARCRDSSCCWTTTRT